MSDRDKPVVVVVPGDLHLTEPDLENVRVASRVIDEVNGLIRPDFVQFIGDNVQDATEAQFDLFDDLRGRLEVPHFAMIGDHDVKDDPSATGFRRHVGEPYGATSLARVPIHPAQHPGVAAGGPLGRADRLVPRRGRFGPGSRRTSRGLPA